MQDLPQFQLDKNVLDCYPMMTVKLMKQRLHNTPENHRDVLRPPRFPKISSRKMKPCFVTQKLNRILNSLNSKKLSVFWHNPKVTEVSGQKTFQKFTCRVHPLGRCFLSSGHGRGLLQDEDHSGSRPHSFPGYYLMRSG